MNIIRAAALGAAIAAGPGVSAPAFAQEDEAAVIRHHVEEWIIGWREGDAERIAAVSDMEHGRGVWVQKPRDGGDQKLMSASFTELTTDMQPRPEYAVPFEILNTTVFGGELAFVTVAAQWGERATVLDYWTLARVNDEWRVIELSWLVRPGMQLETRGRD